MPLLFLFDELLSGTNSKDRRIAAEGVVRMMLAKGAIGMVERKRLVLGNARFLDELKIDTSVLTDAAEALRKDGATAIFVA